MNHVRVFALAATMLLLMSACGSGGDDSALVDALATRWAEEEQFPDSVSIDCIAEGFVSGMGGSEGAATYGITPENIADADFDAEPLSEDNARAASSNMFGCDGFESALLGDMGGDVTDEQAECLADNTDDEPLTALIASSFMGDGGSALESEFENTFETGLIAALATCGIEG